MSHTRYPQIDIMKGLAILGVLFTHAAMAPLTSKPLTDFYALQAVPVFIVLMGLNLSMSLRRQVQAHSQSHYWRRLRRLAVPFAVVFAASSAIAAYRWFALDISPKIGPLTLLGYMPFGGAGNYFVLFIVVFSVVGPALWAAYRRWPKTTIALMLATSLVYELAWAALNVQAEHHSVYGVNPVRLLGAFAIGLWLADGWGLSERRNRWLLGWGAISLAYMVTIQFTGRPPIFPYTWQPQNVLGFGFTGLLVMVGMRWLPSEEHGAWTVLAELGRASYHVFLLQIVYFGFRQRQFMAVPLLEDLVWPSLLGWLFYRADGWLGLSGQRRREREPH